MNNLNKNYPACAVIMVLFNDKKQILLTRRNVEPFKDSWVIPGGHIKRETAIEAVKREMLEETNFNIEVEKIYGVYANLDADDRGPSISIIYIGKIISGNFQKNIEVSEIEFFDLDNLPQNIGFNHLEILQDLKKYPENQPVN